MIETNFQLPIGYSSVGPGCIATVVTSLEMKTPPQSRSDGEFPPRYKLIEFDRSDIAGYRVLFRKVGEAWLWHSRLRMTDEDLRKIIGGPLVEVFALTRSGEQVGLLELDFRQPHQCELAFFGLAPAEIGKGIGRALMNAAIERAWAKPIKRFWVHTCTLDHPGALAFYIKSGFRPYAVQVEVQPDPRLTGDAPRDAAPQVPIIENDDPRH